MYFITIIVYGIPLLSFAWWIWADRRLRALGVRRAGRCLLGVTFLLLFVGYVWVLLARRDIITLPVFPWLYALVLLWGILYLPILAITSMVGWSFLTLGSRICKRQNPELPSTGNWSRRKWLGTLATTMPLLATFATAAISLPRLSRFRVRDVSLSLDELPAALDGMRIAHVTDTHIGKFTNGKVLDEIVSAVNSLDVDLVLFTGDLIDNALRDLPEGIRMMKGFTARSGVFLIEGNHDLFDSPTDFENGVRSSGIAMLRNEAATVQIRGVPVQLLGVVWSHEEEDMVDDVDTVAKLRNPSAFPILMAHHPHVFDRAAHHGFPLTLAGHTHGGQLMLTPGFGAGSVMFHYWTGLYRKAGRLLLVSNGVGNWFPVRVNAPAEIIHLTLRKT